MELLIGHVISKELKGLMQVMSINMGLENIVLV